MKYFLDPDKTTNIRACVTKDDGVTVICQYLQEESRWRKCKRVLSEGVGASASTFNEVLEGDLEAAGLPPIPYTESGLEDPKPEPKQELKIDSDKHFKNLIDQALISKLSQLSVEELMRLRGM